MHHRRHHRTSSSITASSPAVGGNSLTYLLRRSCPNNYELLSGLSLTCLTVFRRLLKMHLFQAAFSAAGGKL